MRKLSHCRYKRSNLYPQLQQFIHGQWNKLNTPLHRASDALNPKWYDIEQTKRRSPSDGKVMKGFMTAIKKIYSPDSKEASLI
jgi:multidrug resistance efflux pump